MIRRFLVVAVALFAALVLPATAVQATPYPSPPQPSPTVSYPPTRVTLTVQVSTPKPGQTFWVRATGPVGKKVTITVIAPTGVATRYVVVIPSSSFSTRRTVSSTTTIQQVGTKGVANFQLTLSKPGRYRIVSVVHGQPRSVKSISVNVKPGRSYNAYSLGGGGAAAFMAGGAAFLLLRRRHLSDLKPM